MWEFGVLGSIEVRGAGGPIELGGWRQRAVLARLLMARGTVVPVNRLLDDVFHREPAGSALAALQSCVSALRRALPPQTLVSLAPGYALRPASVDVEEFESLVRRAHAVPDLDKALALVRGEPYADVAAESWAAGEAGRLAELILATREQRFSMLLAQGAAAETVPHLRALTAVQPYRERLWCLLALALYRCGQHEDALYVVRLACDVIIDELGVEPGHDLRRLEAEIILRTASIDLPSPRIELVPPARPAETHDPLVGRETVLGELGRLADDAESGRLRLAVVSGEPGIGKTRLLGHAAGTLGRRGWSVLWAGCVEGGPALDPWRRMLGHGDDPAPDDPLAPLLSGVPPPRPALAEDARRVMFDAVTERLESLAAQRPLMVVLDDLHWADLASLDLLGHLAETARGPILLTVAGAAPAQPGVRLPLGGLSTGAIAELATAMGLTVGADTVTEISAGTQGNPYFARAALRSVAGGETVESALADGITGAVRRSLRRFPAPVRAALETAALIGADLDAELVAEVGGGPIGEVTEALDLALVTEVLVAEPGTGLRFGHDLVRETLYDDLAVRERTRLHHRALHALAARSAPAAVLARHAFAADPSTAAPWGVAAAKEAAARLAHGDAARWWALTAEASAEADAEPAQRIELLLGLIRALLDAGERERARLVRAGGLTMTGDPVLTARLLTSLDIPLPWTVPPLRETEPGLVGLLESTLAALPYEDTSVRCRMFANLAGELYGIAPADRCDSLAAEAVAMARRLGDPRLLASVLQHRLRSMTRAGCAAETERLACELIELADSEALLGYGLAARMALIPVLAERFDLGGADRTAAECEALLGRMPAPDTELAHLAWRSTRTILAGRPHELRFPAGARLFGDIAGMHRTLAAYYQGQLADPGFGGLPGAEPWPGGLPGGEPWPGGSRGPGRLVRPDPDRPGWAWLSLTCFAAESCVRSGDVARGERFFTELLPHADRLATGHGLVPAGPVGHYLGRLAALCGRPDEAEGFFKDASERCARSGLVWWEARIRAAMESI
ncbi:BTAD domain-containing putative transcriptional regulator [Streptosporangium soli]